MTRMRMPTRQCEARCEVILPNASKLSEDALQFLLATLPPLASMIVIRQPPCLRSRSCLGVSMSMHAGRCPRDSLHITMDTILVWPNWHYKLQSYTGLHGGKLHGPASAAPRCSRHLHGQRGASTTCVKSNVTRPLSARGPDHVLIVPGTTAKVHVFGVDHRAAQPHIGVTSPNFPGSPRS